jgi:lysozyme
MTATPLPPPLQGLPLDLTTRDDLRLDEGRRLKAYRDSMGITTIGYGRNLETNGISDAEAELLLTNDMTRAAADLDRLLGWWRAKPPRVQRVLWNLCFNMGIVKLLTFSTFLLLLKSDDIDGASDDLERTLWFKQVGQRGPRMVQRLQGVI